MLNLNEQPNEEERFHKNMCGLTQLVRELITTCWEAGYKIVPPELIVIGEKYLETYDKVKLINNFIEYTHLYWNEIKDRDETFFIDHANEIFKDFPLQKEVSLFSILFTSKTKTGEFVIVLEDREAIWEYFDSLVKISIKYLHRIRELKMIQKEDGIVLRYRNKIFPQVELKKHAKYWGIKLDGIPN